MAVGGDKFVGSLTQFAAHRGNGFCVRFAFFLPRSAFFPAEAVLQIQGCTAVTVENVMGGGAFQGVIVFSANVVAPERLRKAVDMRGREGQVPVLDKDIGFYIFNGIFLPDAFPTGNIVVVHAQPGVNCAGRQLPL